jgi:uncharacterized membrane protein YkvI
MKDFFRRYLLPGFVFQGITIGGGYATGRELIEFFMPAGPAGGLLGMLVTMAVFSAVLAASFELVRLTLSYDYRSFFKMLLGRGWVLFEIAYILLLIIVLSVIGAAAGEIAGNTFGLPPLAGTLGLIGIIGLLLFYGSELVERSTACISIALYAVYVGLIAWSFASFGGHIVENFAATPVGDGWLTGGIRYAGYNLAGSVGVYFCIRHAVQPRDALIAGALAGPITMVPGVLFFVAMMAFYPEIGGASVPSSFVLGRLQAPWFEIVFQLVVFGALINTGAPMLHAINERVARVYEERGRTMPQVLRPTLSLSVMALSVFAAAAFGLVGLIARGYGWLTWAFIVLQVIPVLTIGIWKIRKLGAAAAAGSSPRIQAV